MPIIRDADELKARVGEALRLRTHWVILSDTFAGKAILAALFGRLVRAGTSTAESLDFATAEFLNLPTRHHCTAHVLLVPFSELPAADFPGAMAAAGLAHGSGPLDAPVVTITAEGAGDDALRFFAAAAEGGHWAPETPASN